METKIAVIGLGYVGLPIALAFAKKFKDTIGFDISEKRVAKLRKGIDPSGDVSPEEFVGSDVVFTSYKEDLRGANFFVAGLVGGIGSCIGGALGFYLGGWIGYDALKVSMKKKYFEKAELLFQKYGVWAVGFAALSPVPYNAFCWSAGACQMKFKPFIIISVLTRIPRFLLMALLGSLL